MCIKANLTIENHGVTAKVITPDDDGHYFFGYYDIQPFDSTGRYHLCHRVAFADRIPKPEDVCEIGAIDTHTGKFIKYAHTYAWNFQQALFFVGTAMMTVSFLMFMKTVNTVVVF